MGWDEDENLEVDNNNTWKGNEEGSKSNKKNSRKNCNRGCATSAAAEDAESKGASSSFGSSSGWEGTGNKNSQRRMTPKQGPSQTSVRFSGSQEQKTCADSSYQSQPNTSLQSGGKDNGWEAHSFRRNQTHVASNTYSTAKWGKYGSPSPGFKDGAWASRTKLDSSGAAQKPTRQNEKSRINTGWGHAYDAAYKPRNKHQGWQPENKCEKNQARGMLQSYKQEANSQSVYINSNRESVPIHPPLAQGWQWGKNSTASASATSESAIVSHGRNDALPNLLPPEKQEGASMPNGERAYQSRSDSEAESMVESDDDWLGSGDDDDSDVSGVSHETQKKNKWFRKFFQSLDALTIEEVIDSSRQWHCPACQGGVGAIDWYKGMQPLLSHAKTIRSKRVKLHRKLAEVLEEELNMRGAAGLAAEGMFGKWKGLGEVTNNQEIIWPPMVTIQNTFLDRDEKDMWRGMGNKELLEYFKGYKAMKARHAYGPTGHRGMSVLIFEESAMGYVEAERLHKHFVDEGRGKDNWDRCHILFHPGGKRVLYGYIATKEDMEIFNKHSKGKARLKYDIRSYQLMVVEPMKKMNEDNQKLIYFKNKVGKEQKHNKILEEAVSIVGRKLRTKENEIKIIRQRATEQHEESTREMNYLEQSYKQQIQQLFEDITRREHTLETMQEEFKKEHIDRCHQLEVDCAKLPKDTEIRKDEEEEQTKIREEIARRTTIVEMSIKETEDYERERQELIRDHDMRRKEFKTRQFCKEVNAEKEFEKERLQILEKYSKRSQEAADNIS